MAAALPKKTPGENGFTMVELVTVIVLVGALGALVLPRLVGPGEFGRRAALDQALSGIRYAQQQAMSRGYPVRYIYGGNTYSVKVLEPATGSYAHVGARSPWQLPGRARFSGNGYLQFNGKGGLVAPAACPESLDVGGGAIRVHCQTGFARHAG